MDFESKPASQGCLDPAERGCDELMPDGCLKRKSDQISTSDGADLNNSSSIARVDLNSECLALQEALTGHQNCVSVLRAELEEERNAAASAANEAMSMILRLQREKAQIQMEARQFKSYAEEKMSQDKEEILVMEHELYRKDQVICSLTCEVQAYKHRLMSLGYSEDEAEGLILGAGEGSLGGFVLQPDCSTAKLGLFEAPDSPECLDKYAFGDTPRSHASSQNVERVFSGKHIATGHPTAKSLIEKLIAGQSPRLPRQLSRGSSNSPFGMVREIDHDNYFYAKKSDNASDAWDYASDRVYKLDSVQGVPYNSGNDINIGISSDYLNPRCGMGESEIKKLFERLQALEVDKELLKKEIALMQTNKVQWVVLKALSLLLLTKLFFQKPVSPKKWFLVCVCSLVSVLKFAVSFVFGRKKPPHKHKFGTLSSNLGLLLLLDSSPCMMRVCLKKLALS